MQLPQAKVPPRHTLKAFWTKKRFLKLSIFSFLLANVTFIASYQLGESQAINNAGRHHDKIFVAYLQTIERYKTEANSKDIDVAPDSRALLDMQRQFPFHKISLLQAPSAEAPNDRSALTKLKNRPLGWSYRMETGGWANSYYVLPAKSEQAFHVQSFIQEDLTAWENTSAFIGAYAFFLLVAFGWFWSRALDESTALPAEFEKKVDAIREVIFEMEQALAGVETELERLSKAHSMYDAATLQELYDITSQVRMLAVNGSIESSRSLEAFRVFHVILDEINHLSTRAGDLLKNNTSHKSADDLLAKVQELRTLVDDGSKTSKTFAAN